MALIKTIAELEKIRMTGAIQRQVMAELKRNIAVGVKPIELDELAEKLIREAGATPAFKNYQPSGARKPFPSTICASLNNVVVHDIPNDQPLKNGDLFKIDLGVRYQEYNTDSAITVILGAPKDRRAYELVEVTRQALELAIVAAQPNAHLGDIGHAIESHARAHKMSVVAGLSGHGIGQSIHEEPSVFNVGSPGQGLELRPGMVLAIEPMITLGAPQLIQTPTEAFATQDGSLTAHFEHTIIITVNGPETVT
ncbi:MAG: type I methionyl aminopeptidase [Candidatus Harrisonbacteria bacterium CG10_big_fil_rev_8_21_14_0_10_45_28]|uniref:Methionine aminopeptidase n=1 Tax=Candidatus Harrisonbacteria bacterium CG10_big_fil_rev_8_21_14_0_10_45_28 TaxID=1974586 RepID=A0A2H0UNM9_9BACT|nr:MAG: type I methionyl aminopeptidase [Candidatus Harrisonbacteria bacterium CG10_big_fil_rev_8_21_14_0_10_45_28]